MLGIANAASPKWSRTFRKRVSKAVYCMHRSRVLTRMLAAVETDSIFSSTDRVTLMPVEESPTAVLMGQSDVPEWSSDVIVASDHRQGVMRTWWSRHAAADHAEANRRRRRQLPAILACDADPQTDDATDEENDRLAVCGTCTFFTRSSASIPILMDSAPRATTSSVGNCGTVLRLAKCHINALSVAS